MLSVTGGGDGQRALPEFLQHRDFFCERQGREPGAEGAFGFEDAAGV